MIQEYQIRILPEQAASEEGIKRYLSKEKGLDVRTLNQVRVLKRSIDARQRTIYVNLKVRAYINEFPQDDQYVHTDYPDVSSRPRVIVVGEGPGGLFASLKLIELGYRPIVLERGKDVRERKKDLSNITKTQKVDAESNYCFGEGGAGAYSDGKLYTRSKKRGSVDKILNVFCQHGANTNILADAHPHIGTDKLPRVIENMRNTVIKCGGEVHFQTKMTRLILESEGKMMSAAVDVSSADRVIGVEAKNLATGAEETYRGPVILATGHSARDVYRYLASSKIEIEAKGIAVGVRLEHPSHLIDQIQYHNKQGRGKYLPAAEYSFVTQVDGRGVYSFCMCPGGFVIPAATGPEQLVVNGMSPSNRGTAWSNSGMVVETHPEDVAQFVLDHGIPSQGKGYGNAGKGYGGEGNGSEDLQSDAGCKANLTAEDLARDPLAMMYFQQIVEKQCWQQGNMKQTAPSQRMADFVNNRLSYDLPKSSYAPGLISSPLHFWMPSFVSHRLQEGFKTFGKNAHGFLTNEAILIAAETRTSSPVRIIRDRETLQHVRIQGLFPCGEGAGYAGGIVSAGVDGERCAEMCAEYLEKL